MVASFGETTVSKKRSLLRIPSRLALTLLALGFYTSVARSENPTRPPLQTIAEKTDYKATSRHADVLDFCERLKKLSPLVRLGELGTSGDGRSLPLIILADPPVSSPEEAAKCGKLVVLAMGNIHAGEVDGKEALLMLARELATAKDKPLLKDLVLVFAPIFNADGNEKISKEHRREQAGPAEGVGVRENAAGLDLNRDFIKLDSPEVRALVRFFTQWDPALFIDCHTTNGSHHRYTITYEGPVCPAGDAGMIALVRDNLLPEVGRRLEKRSGYKSFFYGKFSPDHSAGRRCRPSRAMARTTSDCAIVSASSRNRIATPPSVTASWPRAISSARSSSMPRKTRRNSVLCSRGEE